MLQRQEAGERWPWSHKVAKQAKHIQRRRGRAAEEKHRGWSDKVKQAGKHASSHEWTGQEVDGLKGKWLDRMKEAASHTKQRAEGAAGRWSKRMREAASQAKEQAGAARGRWLDRLKRPSLAEQEAEEASDVTGDVVGVPRRWSRRTGAAAHKGVVRSERAASRRATSAEGRSNRVKRPASHEWTKDEVDDLKAKWSARNGAAAARQRLGGTRARTAVRRSASRAVRRARAVAARRTAAFPQEEEAAAMLQQGVAQAETGSAQQEWPHWPWSRRKRREPEPRQSPPPVEHSARSAPARSAATKPPPLLEDVAAAFDALSTEGVPLVADVGPAAVGGPRRRSSAFHGLQRRQGDSILYLSRDGCGRKREVELVVVRLSSPHHGGALAGDRAAARGGGGSTAVAVVRVAPGAAARAWGAAGVASHGDILAVAAAAQCSALARWRATCQTASSVAFFDTTDPEVPARLNVLIERPGLSASAVALTRESDGRYLVAVQSKGGESLDFYRSTRRSLSETDVAFEKVVTWTPQMLKGTSETDNIFRAYENLSLLWQADGKLFMVGTAHVPIVGWNLADVFQVDISSASADITKLRSKHMECRGSECSFDAASGVYAADPHTLMLYATGQDPSGGSIRIHEFASAGQQHA